MAYPTLAEIKVRLGITDTSQDTALQAALSAARGAVERYCGYVWEVADSVIRVFDSRGVDSFGSYFDVSNPGLLSHTLIEGRFLKGEFETVAAGNFILRRFGGDGIGPYDRISMSAAYAYCRVTGIWGQGATAPAEVSETVMILAMALYQRTAGESVAGADDDGSSFFDDGLIQFMLNGHRRYR